MKVKVKVCTLEIEASSWIITSEVLRYGTCCQGISQSYLHTHTFIHNRNEPYLLHRPRRDGRLSWPGWLVSQWDSLPARRQSPIPLLTGLNYRDQRVTATLNRHEAVPQQTQSSSAELLSRSVEINRQRNVPAYDTHNRPAVNVLLTLSNPTKTTHRVETYLTAGIRGRRRRRRRR